MASFEHNSADCMEKQRIIESIEGFAKEVHKCVARLKNIEEGSVPAIELGLLEQKVIQFYDQLQTLKEQNGNVGKKSTSQGEVDAIKAQFQTLQNELSTQGTATAPDTAPDLTESKAPATEETPIISLEPVAEIVKTEPPLEDVVDEESDQELDKVLEQAQQLMDETPPIVWEMESTTKPEEEERPEEVLRVTKTTITPDETDAPRAEELPEPEQEEVTEPSDTVEENTEDDEKAPSLNERFSAQKTSLHDKLFAQREKQKVLSKQLSGKPVKDLKKAINLNMQIRFTKELFENDKRSFKRTVDFINKCNTYSEARSYAQHEIVQKYELNEENKFYQEFISLVKRRFI